MNNISNREAITRHSRPASLTKNLSAGFKRFLSSAVLLFALKASAATYFVATNGADTNSGTSTNAPWLTIQHAANTLMPGDTVFVRGGIYRERVTFNLSGSAAGGFVAYQNYPGETPIVDGTGLAIPKLDYATGLFEFTNASYVRIQGFEIRNYQTASTAEVPAGIDITGAPHDLTFISNRIHNIANLNNSTSANAYGIAVHGTLAQPISNLVFRSNEIYSNSTGQSETFSLDGNCNGFDISGNLVHDNNNIGIGFIGYEGVSSDANQDYARNGVCRSNTVWNISASSNVSEGRQYDADGIYSDGASNVLIELNIIHHCDIGVEMTSEHKGHAAEACVCRDNVIWSNYTTGISIGGYSTSVGRTINCVITHNTLYHNDTLQSGTGEMELQYAPATNTITHNIFVANSQNLLISDNFTQNTNNTLDWNLYFPPGGSTNSAWQWKKITYTDFNAYKTATTNDTHSIFADPSFVNTSNANFHLPLHSPAVNAGDLGFQSLTNMPVETDIDFQPRVAGGRTDIGADELNIVSPTLAISLPATNELLLQLTGEPGHSFVWQQSGTVSGGWLSFLTNSTDPVYWRGPEILTITDSTPSTMGFFRAQVAQ